MVAASGTRFDGLDLLLIFVIPGILALIMWATYRVQGPLGGRRDDFELVKAREDAKLGLERGGLHLIPPDEPCLFYAVFADPVHDRPIHASVTPEQFTAKQHTLPIYDWRDDPIVFDWMLDDPACA